MIKPMIVPLESGKMQEYALPIACYVCEAVNAMDAEYCTHCLAPMALAHQAGTEKVQPRLFGAIGASGTGKTVFLGMLLDMLSRRPDQGTLLARGAFSITLQQTTIGALVRGEFPSKTPTEPDRWNWVHCQLRRPGMKKPQELILPDMAGEAVLQEIEHPNTFRTIRHFLKKCEAVMIFADVAKIQQGNPEQDFFAMKLLSYLCEIDNRPRCGWPLRKVAVVFTKADQCDACQDDPAAFAAARLPGAWQLCKERFRQFRFFAASVAGACAIRNKPGLGPVSVPLRIEPRGVTEPFLWLMDKP